VRKNASASILSETFKINEDINFVLSYLMGDFVVAQQSDIPKAVESFGQTYTYFGTIIRPD
jgi:hypothetical protein